MTAKKTTKTEEAPKADEPVLEVAKVDVVKPAPKAKAPAKPRAKPAAIEDRAEAKDDAPLVVVDHHSPRYEGRPEPKDHKIVEDPDSHVRYCSKCQSPEHMTTGDDCAPKAA